MRVVLTPFVRGGVRWCVDWLLLLFQVVKQFFRFFLLNYQLIPVSLYVSLNLISMCQQFFMVRDLHMYSTADGGQRCRVASMELNDELGLVTHLLSDKTGACHRVSRSPVIIITTSPNVVVRVLVVVVCTLWVFAIVVWCVGVHVTYRATACARRPFVRWRLLLAHLSVCLPACLCADLLVTGVIYFL